MRDYYVYLKLKSFPDEDADVSLNTIPLRATNVSINVDKTIPSFPIPLSGLASGESVTAALDLGMSNKRISISGFIVDTELRRKHDKASETVLTRKFTGHEIAQMIASSVDSTGVAVNQAVDELVILIPSYVDSEYETRSGLSADPSDTPEGSVPLIPFNFKSRGARNTKDNLYVPLSGTFPDLPTDTGMRGFISSFSHTLAADTIEIDFTLDFVVAAALP